MNERALHKTRKPLMACEFFVGRIEVVKGSKPWILLYFQSTFSKARLEVDVVCFPKIALKS